MLKRVYTNVSDMTGVHGGGRGFRCHDCGDDVDCGRAFGGHDRGDDVGCGSCGG